MEEEQQWFSVRILVPARAAALAGLPAHQRFSLPSSSEELNSIYGSRPQVEVVEAIEEEFYEEKEGSLIVKDLDPRVTVQYGIPSTASVLAFDPVQHLLAVGTLDGRIKVIGGDNIEGLLVSPKQLPFKNLEFLRNQGFLVSVSNENEIQVWDLEHRRINSTLRWESNKTAFSVIHSTSYMHLGDEYGMVSVLKYDAEEGRLKHLPYYVPTDIIAEGAGISSSNQSSVVGVLPQHCSQGKRLLIAYDNGLIVLWDVFEDKVVLVRGNKDLHLNGQIVVNSSQSVRPELFENLQDSEQAEKEICSLYWASTDGSVLAVGYVDGDIMFWNLPIDASTKYQKAENSSNNVVKLQLSSADRKLPVIVLHWSANRSHNGGQLFVYGGDGIGTEEVLTEVSAAKVRASHTPSTTVSASMEWPLKGGVPCQFIDAEEDYLVERLYVAGYQAGSVRIWDATYPTLSLIYVLGSELVGFKTASASAPVSALEFCSFTLSLAIGNACGMILLYKLIRS